MVAALEPESGADGFTALFCHDIASLTSLLRVLIVQQSVQMVWRTVNGGRRRHQFDCEQAGISKKEATAAFDAFVSYIAEAFQSGERCAVRDWAVSWTQRKAREGRNPRTKE